MNKQQLHDAAVFSVLEKLKGMGAQIQMAQPCRAYCKRNYDMIVNNRKVAVRAARVHVRMHRVVVNGKQYCYEYPVLFWNIHRHGKIVTPHPDVWILTSDTYTLVLDSDRVHGHSVVLFLGTSKPRRSRLWSAVDDWTVLGISDKAA